MTARHHSCISALGETDYAVLRLALPCAEYFVGHVFGFVDFHMLSDCFGLEAIFGFFYGHSGGVTDL